MTKHVHHQSPGRLIQRLTSMAYCFALAIQFASCDSPPTGETIRVRPGPSNLSQVPRTDAELQLSSAAASLTNTTVEGWSLSKVGALNAALATITWTVTATEVSRATGRLTVNGIVTLKNIGTTNATLGNVVVNLQTKAGSQWITRSSDIADATNGNAATSAKIVAAASSEGLSAFGENALSGDLNFANASTNGPFSLVPQVAIAPGASVTLLFSASYDNNALHLPTGMAARAEVIVSFGNSASTPSGATNVDINGNGVIDADEAHVRSVPMRLGLTVPAPVTLPDPVLTDGLSDIAAIGTATLSNVTFNLGAAAGTVSLQYAGGASGGSITNCAHLTRTASTSTAGSATFPNLDGIALNACDLQTIAAQPAPPQILSPADGDVTGISTTIQYVVGAAASVQCTVGVFLVSCPLSGSVTFNFAPGSHTFIVTGFDTNGNVTGVDGVTWTVSTPSDFPAATLSLNPPLSPLVALNANGATLPAGTLSIVVLRNPDGTVSQGCDPAEYLPPKADVAGKIVVTVRGVCARADRAIYGEKAGAAAVVMINNSNGYAPFEGDIFGNSDTGESFFVHIPFLDVPLFDAFNLVAAQTASLAATVITLP